MRPPHLLKANYGNEMPRLAVWVDTETDQVQVSDDEVKHVLRFGWAAFRRRSRGGWTKPKWFRFEHPNEFWDWLDSIMYAKARLNLFAHNHGFDLPVLNAFETLPERGWQLTKAVIDSPPIILNWRRKPNTIRMLDTLNWWPMKLEKVGKELGLDKLGYPSDTATPEQWDTYCKRDVEVIMTACMQWWDFLLKHDLGGFAPTLASQALHAYRHRFMHHKILIDDKPKALDLARESYHGGRTECFRIGSIPGPLYQVDINSQYPAAMYDNPMPTRLIGYTKRATLEDLRIWLKTRAVTANVEIDTDEPAYAVVHDKKLVFPVGRFSAPLSTPELSYALQHGHIKSINAVAVFEQAVIFAEYVDYLYKLRINEAAKGNSVIAWQAKILLNSLYGKFGQHGRVYETHGTTNDMRPMSWREFDMETGETVRFRQLCGLVQSMRNEGESRDSHPAISAHVCAYARMKLWELFLVAGRERVFYCDTDSILTDRTGFDNLSSYMHPTELGKLKLEMVAQSATFYGPKDYVIGSKVKTKGVKANALWLRHDQVEQEQWSSLVGLLGRGDMSAPRTMVTSKHLRRVYTKGNVYDDGSITPLCLPDNLPPWSNGRGGILCLDNVATP